MIEIAKENIKTTLSVDSCKITRRFTYLIFDTLPLRCTILLYHNTQQTKTHSETLFKRREKEELRNYTVGRTKVAIVPSRFNACFLSSLCFNENGRWMTNSKSGILFWSWHGKKWKPFVWYAQSYFIKRAKWWIFRLRDDLNLISIYFSYHTGSTTSLDNLLGFPYSF